MMLDHLGQPKAAQSIIAAIETVLSEPKLRTRDLGGRATTGGMRQGAGAGCFLTFRNSPGDCVVL